MSYPIIIAVIFIFAIFAAIYLKRSSDKVWKDLEQFEHRAMYGPKCDIVTLRYEMWDYKGCFHWGHTEYLKSIWKITDARQRYEKDSGKTIRGRRKSKESSKNNGSYIK